MTPFTALSPRFKQPISPSPSPRSTFDFSLDLTRDPPAVKIPWLRLHPLPVHITLPRTFVEAHVVFDGTKGGRRGLISPGSVVDRGVGCNGRVNAEVGGRTFPFAVGLARGFCQGGLDVGGRDVVGCNPGENGMVVSGWLDRVFCWYGVVWCMESR